jgi:nucleosome assembly protein 1-like 1
VKGEFIPQISNEDIHKYGLENTTTANPTENGVPNFWLNAIKNSKYWIINEKDEAILKHLVDIKLHLQDSGINFSIEFIFSPNEYFTTTSLSKEYIFDNETYELSSTKASNITWNTDKNPRKKTKTKKIKSKNI